MGRIECVDTRPRLQHLRRGPIARSEYPGLTERLPFGDRRVRASRDDRRFVDGLSWLIVVIRPWRDQMDDKVEIRLAILDAEHRRICVGSTASAQSEVLRRRK